MRRIRLRLRRWQYDPPLKTSAGVLIIALVTIVALVWLQFRGYFTPTEQLTLVTNRSGLVMDPGARVTFNGVQIGRVASVKAVNRDARAGTAEASEAQLQLAVSPRYLALIPSNVRADIVASTVFGGKYVSLTSPTDPSSRHISASARIDASSVTTEFNTLFETITAISERVDPVKLNATLSAAAESLTGLGDSLGGALVDSTAILDDLNSRMAQIRYDNRRIAELAGLYADTAPDLFAALDAAVTTARTLDLRQDEFDSALMAAVGFADTGTDVLTRAQPFLLRGAADLTPTSTVLDTYSPELFCMIRNYHDAAPKIADSGGGNGYSMHLYMITSTTPNAYIYPDNLPRVNAHGGPGGAPGCWQPITRELWPAPYLVADTGASIAPYNHLEPAQPLLAEYVWGRQIGEHTINP
ncbi:MCE family protein [Mycolicibacterium palauense]|uniref:MCE family protein n=1 Tax=Mycolicibacterium palauense TaxID=2034511 RepID=UPI003898E85F